MKISWNGNAANVGKFELRVNRANTQGMWQATIWLWLHPLKITRDHTSSKAARQWCERELLKLVEPMISQARAEGATQEREKTLATINELIAQEQRIVSAAQRNAATASACSNRFGVERFDARALAAEDRIVNLNKLVAEIRTRKDDAQ